MAKQRKSFKSLPKRAKKAAFADMSADGKLFAKSAKSGRRTKGAGQQPLTGQSAINAAARQAARRAGSASGGANLAQSIAAQRSADSRVLRSPRNAASAETKRATRIRNLQQQVLATGAARKLRGESTSVQAKQLRRINKLSR